MSAIIHHFVVHQLTQSPQGELSIIPREQCFDVTPDIEELAQQINQAFNSKPGKGVGGFVSAETMGDISEEDAQYSDAFHLALKDVLEQPDGFIAFSKSSCDMLKKSLINTGTVETGFIVFSHYEFLATEYLMIALLNTRQHVEINQHLELSYSDHLDLAKMQLAVRIDLTQYKTTPEQSRYISFIKGRMGRKVSDFFMQFVGCEELVDVKQQNKQLVQNVDAYLSSEQLDPEEKQQSRQIVSDYYKEKLEQGEDIAIKELAAKLPNSGSEDFYHFNQSSEQPIEEQFQADRGMLKSLAKFSGQGGGVTVSFDRKLLGDRVSYDPATDTLVIRGIPPNLKDQLLRSND